MLDLDQEGHLKVFNFGCGRFFNRIFIFDGKWYSIRNLNHCKYVESKINFFFSDNGGNNIMKQLNILVQV